MQKIMFNEQYGLQQATFDGIKDMTRRVIPQCILDAVPQYQEEYYAGALEHIEIDQAILNMVGPEKMFQQYVYRVGEIVAIAQQYSQLVANGHLVEDGSLSLMHSEGWGNKMYVKAELMQRHIKMTGIKVEGLAGISDEDCLKEGIQVLKGGFRNQDAYTFKGDKVWWKTPYLAYKELIDRLNKRGYFESNPMVYAYTYELVD